MTPDSQYSNDIAAVHRIVRGNSVIVHWLRALRNHHEATADHDERVYHLAVSIAAATRTGFDNIAIVGFGAISHDFGKVYIDPALLDKRENFNSGDRLAMSAHAARGAEIIARLGNDKVEYIVRHHHDLPADASTDVAGLTRIVMAADMVDAAVKRTDNGYSLNERVQLSFEKFLEHAGDERYFELALSWYPSARPTIGLQIPATRLLGRLLQPADPSAQVQYSS